MDDSSTHCPKCGCEVTKPLSILEHEEREKISEGKQPEELVLDRLKPPLGPSPLPPQLWGFLVFIVMYVVLAEAGMQDGILLFLVALFASLGIYYSILKAIDETKRNRWRGQIEGALVCQKFWATFFPPEGA